MPLFQDINSETSELTNIQCPANQDDQADEPIISELENQTSIEEPCQTSSDSILETKKDKKLRHIINRYQSYKKDLIGDDTEIQTKHQKKKESVEENDDLVINIDQDDLDCIICD